MIVEVDLVVETPYKKLDTPFGGRPVFARFEGDPSMIARLRRARSGDDGAAAVEFALVVPLLLLVVFGIVAFGLLLFAQISATHAAREGARLAAVGVNDCDDWRTEVDDRAGGADTTQITLALSNSDGDAAIDPGDTATVNITFATNDSANAALNAAVNIVSIVPGSGFLMPDTLNAEAESRVERVGTQTSCS